MKIKHISRFTGIILLIGVFIIYELFNFNTHLKNSFEKSEKILNDLNTLKQEEYKLNYLVLKTTFYLYENNDNLVDEINKINKNINKIKKDKFFIENYPQTYKDFLNYSKLFNSKKNDIYRFFTYNSLINSL